MVSVSIGVAIAHAGTDPEHILNQADLAMYAAKRQDQKPLTQVLPLMAGGTCTTSVTTRGSFMSALPLIEPVIEPSAPRPPLPPFDEAGARMKVQSAEDAWNTRDPAKVAAAYTQDSVWRNRTDFITGRAGIVAFLTSKWQREQDYALRKSLWGFGGNRIAVRFQYEWHDDAGQWWRSYGNEDWEFDTMGYMNRREASINDLPIAAADRRIFGPRPAADHDQELPLQ